MESSVALFTVRVRKLALITVALPFLTLFVCFLTAYLFRFDDVHETHCQVYNVIPSISAITGITPQTYLWRISVAMHIGPRVLVAQIYRSYFAHLAQRTIPPGSIVKSLLIKMCYWFNIIELTSLCGVTYISNKENYPIHEKLFVTFMICSLAYMCLMSWAYQTIHPSMNQVQKMSYRLKKFLLILSVVSTFTLIFFFLKHRFYCHDLAFTWFALSEYVIAGCNMGFHMTVALDFPDEELVVVSQSLPSSRDKKDD